MKDNSNLPIIKDKKSVFIEDGCTFGKNVIIYPNNTIEKGTVIGDNVTLLPGNFISGSHVGKGAKIFNSVIENSKVGEGCLIGPYSHLRPKTTLASNVKIGNFCEIKNSFIGENSKVSHLAYVGDSVVGKNCNIGCGAIFVNYNGKSKSNINIGDNCFIGSNVNLIAPVSVANKSYICAGTTLTDSTKEEDFVIGRVKPTVKPNYSAKYIKER